MATLNVNSWHVFKHKLTDQNFQDTVGGHTVLCLQETKLGSADSIRDAVEYCKTRGWLAIFGEAVQRESGMYSGGVAILIQDGLNIGIAAVGDVAADLHHRLTAVRLDVPGFGCMVAASTYFEAVSGLSEVNRKLLADIALLQHRCQLPVAVWGRL